VNGAVLGVDGQELSAFDAPEALHDGRPGNERLLVRESQAATFAKGGHGHAEAGKADDGVEHDVAGLDKGRERVGPRSKLDAGGQQLGKSRGESAVSDGHDVGAELLGLSGKQVYRSRRPESTYRKTVPSGSEHFEGLGADRTGRTDDGYPLSGIVAKLSKARALEPRLIDDAGHPTCARRTK
jgi:hypothetical protein